jgi:hypothetical protein
MAEMSSYKKPQTLHMLNAMRVFAEYWVVRFHCLPNHHYADEFNRNRMGPIGDDIMGFFFVLSGFSAMYTYEYADLTGTRAKWNFIQGKLKRIYPIFLLTYLCALHHHIVTWSQETEFCWVVPLCSVLQLFMLDGWAGCGYQFTVVGLAWYLSCVLWLWLAFPFFKGFLQEKFFGQSNIWIKMFLIYIAWIALFFSLWNFDIQTLAGVPALRLGEFLLGCGSACALRVETPRILTKNRFWIPFVMIIIIYNWEGTNHGLDFICLRELIQHSDCTLWHSGQKQYQVYPPCITIAEKILNKFSLIHAVVIHGIAKAELADETSCWFMKVLQADLFKFLNTFSITLYLSHINMSCVIKWLGQTLMNWNPDEWRDDILLILVYSLCFALHCVILQIQNRFNGKGHKTSETEDLNAQEHQPLVIELGTQFEQSAGDT